MPDDQTAAAPLECPPGGRGLNIAHEAVDRQAEGTRGAQVALRFLRKDGGVEEVTFLELRALTNRFANVLSGLGIQRGDTVVTLAGRVPELYTSALGALKHGAVFCPLFSDFGPEPVRQRLQIGKARVLVTTEILYKRRVEGVRTQLPDLRRVLLIGERGEITDVPGTLDFGKAMAEASDRYQTAATSGEDPALLHFTSGTTGTPKGAIHVHAAVDGHRLTGSVALDMQEGDVFWCTADPGWITGTSYGIISPLTNGVTSIVDEAEFNGPRWLRTLEEQQVSVWYTAPTAIRRLMRLGTDVVCGHNLSHLRFVGSVGEPLDGETVIWGGTALGVPVHDTWWQTETGGIMIANYPSMTIKPGSMGRPLPGVTATVLRRRANGQIVIRNGIPEEVPSGTEGELALRAGWPSMFRGYLGAEDDYRGRFVDDWYLTGDLVRRDADGYFWFIGRGDDVIKTSGHLIGPFEVESVLLGHPAVFEAGVVGQPDPVAGEIVKAFVSLRPGWEPSEDLRLELLGFARMRLGAVVAPREIEFRADLPKTRSGKIMRRLLRAGEAMKDDALRDLIVGVMRRVAPEADLSATDPDSSLEDELELDSMDFLNFVSGLHEATGIEIPESDYPDLSTLNGCISYLRGPLGSRRHTGASGGRAGARGGARGGGHR